MTVTGISPNISMVNQTVPVTITGTNFTNANAVKLTKTGQSDIPATNFIVVNATTITANINLNGVQPGLWNMVVTSPVIFQHSSLMVLRFGNHPLSFIYRCY